MKIAFINGSPKTGKSNSGWMLEQLEKYIGEEHDLILYKVGIKPLSESDYENLCQMDVLVFAFPLYIDAIPSHLFRMLIELEQTMQRLREKDIFVYVIVNNGFFEGTQNHIALDIMKNWCDRTGLHYGQGIGQGAGEMMGFIDGVPLGHGPLKNLGNALDTLAQNIKTCHSNADMLFSPNFPRFAWRFMATFAFWHPHAKKNGLKIRDIKRRVN